MDTVRRTPISNDRVLCPSIDSQPQPERISAEPSLQGDHPDSAVAETVAAAFVAHFAGALAFMAPDDYMDILKLLGRQFRKFATYFGVMMLDKPMHELVFDLGSVVDAEMLAAVLPPAGEALVADRISTGLEEITGLGTEVELSANRTRFDPEQAKGILHVRHVALEARYGLAGAIFRLGSHGELYSQPPYSQSRSRVSLTGAE